MSAKTTKTKAKRDTSGKRGGQAEEPRPSHGGRETMESIIVAVILAFLFRSFVGEAFVIPTGSMAPTLQGRHLDVACDGCKFRYRVGASRKDPVATGCPNCGKVKEPQNGVFSNERPFSGDRILVSKFSYDLHQPERWDVIVFKFPGNAKQNYIKRLVGLPNELIKIEHGNVYATPVLFQLAPDARETIDRGQISDEVRAVFAENDWALSEQARVTDADEIQPFELNTAGRIGWTREIEDGDRGFLVSDHEGQLKVYDRQLRILKKPPAKLLAMLQVVHDSRYVNEAIHELGWPHRWHGAGWSTDQGRTYVGPDNASSSAGAVSWLRYRQLNPSDVEWEKLDQGEAVTVAPDAPGELITDFYAYNYDESHRGQHWVSDLAIEASVQTTGSQGAVWLELIRAGRHYRCRFDLATGEAKLDIDGGADAFGDDGGTPHPVAASKVRGAGTYRLRMSNVDDQIRVWVNNRLLAFDSPTDYVPTSPDEPQWSPTDPGDTEPAGVGSEQAAIQVKRLRVLRDIYYIAINSVYANEYATDYNVPRRSPFGGPATDLLDYEQPLPSMGADTPPQWSDRPGLFETRRSVSYALGKGQFFPMGDNSPYSEDARRWSSRGSSNLPPHYVEEELMIGKALLIYWPHSWRPFFPNFGRMGLIR